MWQAVKDPVGKYYYVDTDTNKSQWEKPQELWTKLDYALNAEGWAQYSDAVGDYWYNASTQVSTREMPLKANIDLVGGHTTAPVLKRPANDIDIEKPRRVKLCNSGSATNGDSEHTLGAVKLPFEEALPDLVVENSYWDLPTATEREQKYTDILHRHRINRLKSILGENGDHDLQELLPDATKEELDAARSAAKDSSPLEIRRRLELALQTDTFDVSWDKMGTQAEYSAHTQLFEEAASRWRLKWAAREVEEAENQIRDQAKARIAFVKLVRRKLNQGLLKPGATWSEEAVRRELCGPELRALCGNQTGSTPEILVDEVVNQRTLT